MDKTNDIETGVDTTASLKDEEQEIYGLGALVEEKFKLSEKFIEKYKRKKGPVRSNKVTFDGITFASGLEKHMHIALKKAKIPVSQKSCL